MSNVCKNCPYAPKSYGEYCKAVNQPHPEITYGLCRDAFSEKAKNCEENRKKN